MSDFYPGLPHMYVTITIALFPVPFENPCNEAKVLIATSFKNEKNSYTQKGTT